MNLVETFSHGVQTKAFDGLESDPATIYYEVLVEGKVAWRRKALPGTDLKSRQALATAQMREALHLVALAEAEDRRKEQERINV